jgi:2-oxo-hept-3-ene-1,7-dioate hydratase
VLSEEQRRAMAEALIEAERLDAPIEPLSETHPDAEVEDAYRIALLVTDLKVRTGRRIKGHKIGLTSKAMRSLWGATEPDYGTLFDDRFAPEGSTIPMSRRNRPLVEVELAFVLGSDLVGPGVNAADVIRATEVVLPALEIVDSRYVRRGPRPLVDSISDAASCGLVVLGGRACRLTDVDLRRVGATLSINGTLEESGVAAAVMGNPVNSVAWLANKLHDFAVPLEAGHVVLSGSFVRAVPFTAGDTIMAIFDHFGDVTIAAG